MSCSLEAKKKEKHVRQDVLQVANHRDYSMAEQVVFARLFCALCSESILETNDSRLSLLCGLGVHWILEGFNNNCSVERRLFIMVALPARLDSDASNFDSWMLEP
jgi:hypothetical protein